MTVPVTVTVVQIYFHFPEIFPVRQVRQVYQMGFHNRVGKKPVCSQLGVTFVSDGNKNGTRSGVSLTEL